MLTSADHTKEQKKVIVMSLLTATRLRSLLKQIVNCGNPANRFNQFILLFSREHYIQSSCKRKDRSKTAELNRGIKIQHWVRVNPH